MAGVTEAVVEEIKARIELADLIESYGIQVHTAGASKKACCPFHNEKTPSFNINENKGLYHCFGCGESGDAIKFVQKMEGLTFIEAVKKLAQRYGVKIEEKEDEEAGKRKRLIALMAELSEFYRRCLLQTKEAELAREYLESRALDQQVGEAWKIGYAPNGVATMLTWAKKHGYTAEELEEAGVVLAPKDENDRGYHRFGGRLMFSICDRQGRVVAFSGRQLVASKKSGKYVNSPETLIFKKSKVLFGFDKAAGNIAKSPHREAIVCEGQIDTIRLHISGFPVAVASQGTAFTEEHVKMVKKVADQVVLVFDDDAAGHKATIRTAGLFLAAEMPVRVVSLPGGDDPDSYLRNHPSEDFQKLLDNADSIMSFQVRAERAKEANPRSVDAVNRISKAMLATIAQAKSAVLRASMVGEASELLGLPSVALQEELGRAMEALARKPVHVAPQIEPEPEEMPMEAADGVEEKAELGEDAAMAIPMPPHEQAFCEFLMANEYDKTIDGIVGEFLPDRVFLHGFTKKFVGAWRIEVANGSDTIIPWSEKLSPKERKWFDSLVLGQVKTQDCGLSSTDILQEMVRQLWADYLRRVQGALVVGNDEDETTAMRISIDLKRLQTVRWHTVKELIRNWSQVGSL